MTDEEKAELQIPKSYTYYTVDHELLMVSGNKKRGNFFGFTLRFNLCDKKVRSDCFSDEFI